MPTTALDSEVTRLTQRLADLRPEFIALFSAACAERLAPFYEYFTQRERWGDYGTLRCLLDSLWEYLSGRHELLDVLGKGLSDIEQLIPHSDDFADISCVLAQDFGICLDLGIRCCLRLPSMSPHAVQYSLEGLRALVTLRETGASHLGDSPERLSLDERLLHDELIRGELEAQEAVLERLRAASQLSDELVQAISRAAKLTRYDPPAIIAEQRRKDQTN